MAASTDGSQKRQPRHLAGGQQKPDLLPGHYRIRKYEDRDFDSIRNIFANGIREHIPAALWYTLRRPVIHLVFLGVFLTAYVTSASLSFSLGAVSVLLAVTMMYMRHIWEKYVEDALASDMFDIKGVYLEPKDCCLWVVEASRGVVGMVAAIHPSEPSLQGRALELKRMSVGKEHRGQGLAKALTRTVIQFAQEHGYEEVFLQTSMVQYAAQRIYESLGFHKVKEIAPFFLAKLVQFHIYCYSFKITGTPGGPS